MAPGFAKKLSGQVEWAEAAVMGRQLRAFLWPIRDHEKLSQAAQPSPAFRSAAQCMAIIFNSFPERKVYSNELCRPHCVGFTDARGKARDNLGDWGHEGIGGVLFCSSGVHFFTIPVRSADIEAWLPPKRSIRINEAESLGPLVFIHTMAPFLTDADCIIFVNNTAAEGTLINAYSSNPYLVAIAGAFWEQVGRLGCAVWLSRVPSKLNLADPISREDLSIASQGGWKQHAARIPCPGHWLPILEQGRSRDSLAEQPRKLQKQTRKQMLRQGR